MLPSRGTEIPQVPVQGFLLQPPYFKTEYVITVQQGCPIPEASPNVAVKCDPMYPLQSSLSAPPSTLA